MQLTSGNDRGPQGLNDLNGAYRLNDLNGLRLILLTCSLMPVASRLLPIYT
jgi:hypothetical protein